MQRPKRGITMVGSLDDEIERMGNNFWNHVEPTQRAVILEVIGDRYKVQFNDLDINPMKARALRPCYRDDVSITCDSSYCTLHLTVTSVPDLQVGDSVLVAFKRGQISDPIIVGKY